MKTIKIADILSAQIKKAANAGLTVEIKGLYWVHEAMREACNQCFDLAEKEAKVFCYYDDDDDTYNAELREGSILKLKEQVI